MARRTEKGVPAKLVVKKGGKHDLVRRPSGPEGREGKQALGPTKKPDVPPPHFAPWPTCSASRVGCSRSLSPLRSPSASSKSSFHIPLPGPKAVRFLFLYLPNSVFLEELLELPEPVHDTVHLFAHGRERPQRDPEKEGQGCGYKRQDVQARQLIGLCQDRQEDNPDPQQACNQQQLPAGGKNKPVHDPHDEQPHSGPFIPGAGGPRRASGASLSARPTYSH